MGIGLAVAQRLAADGYHVVGVDWNAEALDRALGNLGGRGDRHHGRHRRLVDARARRRSRRGRRNLRAWVNNAGIDVSSGAHEVDAEHIDRGLRVLLHGPMYGTAVAVRRMLAGGGGAIVNVASIQGVVAFPNYYVYGAAKAGVVQIARNVCVDYGHRGIRCNTVLPGTILTAMTDSMLPDGPERDEALRTEGRLAPMGRVGEAGGAGRLDRVPALGRGLVHQRHQPDRGRRSTARCFAYEPGSRFISS